MRACAILLTGLLVAVTGGSAVVAQTKKPAERPPSETVRYFQFLTDLMGDLPVEAFLKETRQGAKVVSAVLDVCHSVSLDSSRKDRYVVPLKVEGDKYAGSAQSQVDKLPITVSIVRKRADDAYNFTGTITRGTTKYDVAVTDSSDISETAFRESQPADDEITEAPAKYMAVSPDSLAVKVNPEALIPLVNELRAQNVIVDAGTLATECPALRSGGQMVRLQVAPDRAPAVMRKLKSVAGVSAAGWVMGTYTIETAILIQAAPWRQGAEVDRNKVAAAVAAAAAKSLNAKLDSTSWDDRTGELTIKLKRANQVVPQLKLTDNIEVTWQLSSEGPAAKDALVLWFGEVRTETADEGPEPRLELLEPAGKEEEGSAPGQEELIAAVARDLNGKQWDPDASAWK
jgi:hypothetical protein